MRRVTWSDEAVENLEAIGAYVAGFNPLAAQRFTRKLIAAAESLTEFPDRGQAVRSGTRDLLAIPPYLIRYVVLPDEIRIIKIRHSARRPER